MKREANTLTQFPLLQLLPAFILGILVAIYFPTLSFISFYLIFALVLVFIILVKTPRFVAYRTLLILGVFSNSLIFSIAYKLTILKTAENASDYFANYIADNSIFIASVSEDPLNKAKSRKLELSIDAIFDGNKYFPASGNIIAYIEKNEAANKIRYGDRIVFKSKLETTKPPQNPAAFDYKEYLRFHNIYHTTYIKSNEWFNTNTNNGNIFICKAIQLQHYLLELFSKYKIEGEEHAVIAALLLGYKADLDDDLVMAYSSSGAMHVLAVSGLHVGIVFMVFSWMFYFLEKIKYGKIGKSLLLILLLWSYALLTGLSPSVLRACTMFSFVIVGKSLNRYVSIYNILAVSAMFLLLINPYIIMEVGFQLSYLAVLGIVYIQPKMQLIWEPKNSWLQRIWTLITVSISAQIATFPLGLHYFHQFPIWFILSNLIVIPLSTAIIYIAILLLCIAKVSFIADLVAVLLKATLFSLNYSVKKIKDLPYSLLEGIHISVLETWIIYGIILLFLFYLFKRKFKFLVYCLLLLVAILTMQVLEQFQELKQKKFIVYNVSKNSALEIIAGKKHFFIGNHTLVNNEKEMRFNIKHNWWKLGLSNTVYLPTNYCSTIICKIKNTISFDKCLIAIVAKDFTFNFSSKIHKLKVDYLIVANNPKLSIEQLLKVYQVKKIIFDSSNSYYHLNKWKIACAKFKQPFYSVADCGAFVVNF